MTRKRSSGHCLIFKDYIYVFGGYTGKSKRSRCIEKYDHEQNKWTPLDFKMDIGIESGFLTAGNILITIKYVNLFRPKAK